MALILVTGATGNVGQAVCMALAALGTPYRAGDVDPQRIKSQLGQSVEAVRFVFGDESTYPAAFAGIDKVFLMRPPQIADVKKYMFPAIDAAVQAGVKHFVFLSLIGIENNTIVPHYKVEQYLKQLPVEHTFLRASFFMQNFNTTHRTEIRERNEIFIPAGSSRTSFIDVRDIGAVAAVTLTQSGHAGQAYDLTGPEALDYPAVAAQFSAVLGRPILFRNPSILSFIFRQLTSGTRLLFVLVMAFLYTNTRAGMAAQVTHQVEQLTGQPAHTLRQYIEAYRPNWE